MKNGLFATGDTTARIRSVIAQIENRQNIFPGHLTNRIPHASSAFKHENPSTPFLPPIQSAGFFTRLLWNKWGGNMMMQTNPPNPDSTFHNDTP